MTLKNTLYGTGMLAGLGAGAYFMHIYYLTKFLEPAPTELAASYLKALNAVTGHDGSSRYLTFAYQAPTVLPSNQDLADVFGMKTIAKQASYVAANGGKNVAGIYREKKGNGSLGAIIALQALERATPLKQLRAAALFWEDLRVSSQFNYVMHNCRWNLAAARELITAAESPSVALGELHQYCALVRELTGEKAIGVDPALRMAMLQTSCETALGAALAQPSKDSPKPRAATLFVVFSAPIPEGVEEGSWNLAIRRVCSDWYARWVTVNAASAIPHL